jgi:hypothetical protein
MIDIIKARYRYDPNTGELISLKKGVPVGGIDSRGYLKVRVGKKNVRVHRICWLLHYGRFPEGLIDHANRNKLDNRLSNLRIATPCENSRNRGICRRNSTGLKGVTWDKSKKKFKAQIRANDKPVFIGWFVSAEIAHQAYIKASDELHGPFGCHG